MWGRTFDKLLKPLFILQKRAVRLCSCAPFRAHTSPLFNSMKLLKLPDILFQNTLLFMFKFRNNMLPVTFFNSFHLNSDLHSLNTRRKDDYHLPKFRNSYLLNKSIRYQGPLKWNSLNHSLKGETNFNAFKREVKRTILATYWYWLTHCNFIFIYLIYIHFNHFLPLIYCQNLFTLYMYLLFVLYCFLYNWGLLDHKFLTFLAIPAHYSIYCIF